MENRLVAVTNTVTLSMTQFYYDGDGQRVKKVSPSGTIAYVGNYYEYSNSVATSYYPSGAGSTRIAMRAEGDPDPAKNGVYYLHADHPSTSLRASLGSASLATDASGNKLGELRYLSCGGTRYTWDSTPTDRRFTSQLEESGLGSLYDYGARRYSPYLNRWIQPDTIVPQPGNPQDLNRYSYCTNNPLKYIDPSGHSWIAALLRGVEAGITNAGIAIGRSGPMGAALMVSAAEATAPLQSIADAGRNPSTASFNKSFWAGVESWDKAYDSMGAVGEYTASAVAEGRLDDASRGASGLGQMGGTLAQVPGKVALQMAKGAVTFPAQVPKDAWEFGTAARESMEGKRGGWDVVWHGAMLGGDVYAVYSMGTGREYELDNDHRVAPFGNRTDKPTGQLPHYHRRGPIDPATGRTIDGQGIGRHRPWDTRSTDTSFWDRW